MSRYKTIEVIPEMLESALNAEAGQGWRLSQAPTLVPGKDVYSTHHGRTFKLAEGASNLIVVLEKETP